uniref:Uncharacterized protein n=1 Tax=viral metagenome TaxID=1070528 RepID=A0A6C0I3F7_9ZZZZ
MVTDTSDNEIIADTKTVNKYKNVIHYANVDEVTYNALDKLLEDEKTHNKSEPWNKLDKTVKIQKLNKFAETYGKDNALPTKDVKALKTFFLQSLEQNKLQKTKDVIYDKETKDITSIPSLIFNQLNRNFTLKNMDPKRVSTLKSLTPKRVVEKKTIEIENETIENENV